MLMQMINHDDCIVHNQTKTDRQSCQRIQMNIHFQKIEDNRTQTQIDQDTQKQYAEIFEVSVDQENKYNQDQNGEPRSLINLIQLFI